MQVSLKATVLVAIGLCSSCASEATSATDPELAVTSAALELTSVAPDVAAPLWVRSPIVLQFSAPLEAASVSTGIRLESEAGPVPFTHQLDGAALTLQIGTPPLAPSTLTLSVTAELRDLAGGTAQPTTRSWQLPLWHVSAASGASARAPKLARRGAAAFVAWEAEASIQVASLTPQGLTNLAPLPVEAGATLSDFVVDAQGRPTVAWLGGSAPHVDQVAHVAHVAHVARHDATAWLPLDTGLGVALTGPQLALSDQDALIAAWPTSTGVEVASWSLDGPWQPMAPSLPAAAATAVDVAWSSTGAVLAAVVSDDLQLHSLEAGAWRQLSAAVEHNQGNSVREVAVDAGVIAWTELSDGASLLYVSRFADDTGALQALGPALNVSLDSHVEGLTLAADGGTPLLAFQELVAGRAASYVARWSGASFEVLGGSLGGRGGAAVLAGPPMAAVARADTGGIELHRYNESPATPFGLGPRKPQPCTLPPDSDPAFPKLLSQTGCYSDLATKTEADGWIPYELNSPLWSDGAAKRRFFSIPDNTTIGFTETDSWNVPVGTMLAKEFWLQRDPADPASRFIIETRLMIKRCEPGSCRASWQGYSYQWSPTGDDATLLDNNSNSVLVEWPVNGGTHTHTYPGRDECTRCHALSAGGALGLRTQQLNRNHAYSGTVDHQLRALFHTGIFGDAQPPAAMATLLRLPTPSDAAYELDAQVRGYFDANCSHCHSPTSRWPVVDLRFDAQLRADDGTGTTGNICNMLTPGDAEASILYVKLKAVPGAVPEGFPGDTMPPIGRLLPDEPQVARIKTWIDTMTACP
jgi:hypothetical protein